jgi:hypothetical protein
MAPLGKPKRRIRVEPLPYPKRREDLPREEPSRPVKDPASPRPEKVPA